MNKPQKITLDMMRETFYTAAVCDACDAAGYLHQSPRLQIRPMTGCNTLVGRCKTTLWADMAHEDPQTYELELTAVDNCKPDEVIIVAGNGSTRSGIWGELLSTASRNSGCVGVIADGMVRDIQQMTKMKFPVFARGACVYDSMNRQRVINIDVPVEIAGVRFCPNDLVIADLDGVVVVPQEVEDEVVHRTWEKIHAESRVLQEIEKGMKAGTAWERYGIL